MSFLERLAQIRHILNTTEYRNLSNKEISIKFVEEHHFSGRVVEELSGVCRKVTAATIYAKQARREIKVLGRPRIFNSKVSTKVVQKLINESPPVGLGFEATRRLISF